MYDPQTAELIRSAPPLPNLDLDSLPQQLTEAYAEIVSIRSSIAISQGQAEDALLEKILQLRRLANTYESYVSLLPEHPSRTAAAYISATAHRLIYLATSASISTTKSSNYIHQDGISSDIAAMLLFLIAGYPPDATELSLKITGESNSGTAAVLVSSLSDLAAGRLQAILQKPSSIPLSLDSASWEEVSTEALWIKLLNGLRVLASLLLGSHTEGLMPEAPLAEFLTVQRLAVERLTLEDEQERTGFDEAVYSTFAGPHHLATLLLDAGRDLLKRAVTKITPPPTVSEEDWIRYVANLATKRPYLWPNHLQAISEGYLDPTRSVAVSFPTGAGKSTLAELRIAVTLLRGGKALFLVPTHALVSQVTQDLRESFPEATIRNSVIADDFYAEVERPELPDVAIMTPERCLTLIGVSAEPFSNIELLIFDECHLMHPKSRDDRRSLDSMLCLLNLFAVAPRIKILMMSAMMSNTSDIADWLTQATGTPCLSLELNWKPTRQVRGCVVFPSTEVRELSGALYRERQNIKPKARNNPPPQRIQVTLHAQPFGLFCLSQTWEDINTTNYRLLQILPHSVQLSASKFWSLTPNRNHVATELAVNFSSLGMKTLIFAQNLNHSVSIARNTATLLDAPGTTLSEGEQELFDAAIQETGGAEHTYLPFNNLSACHHGLLLPTERRLSESLFARRDGINILAATPTLAQGMNLPAQVVIIAGDDRFDPSTDRPLRLEAHEVLNAAGRAGRAGYNSQGMVLVVPGAVIDFDPQSHSVQGRWFELQERIFSKSDQCLAIEDPIDALLDFIQLHGATTDSTATYFLNRLPLSSKESGTEAFLSRSLAAFYAKKHGNETVFLDKLRKVSFIHQTQLTQSPEGTWHTDLASKSGVSPKLILALDQDLTDEDVERNMSIADWVSWLTDWTRKNTELSSQFFAATEIQGWFKKSDPHDLFRLLTDSILSWITGATLREIESSMGTSDSKIGYCQNARKLTIRKLPQLSYGLGLLAQIYRYRLEHDDSKEPIPLVLATAAACVRSGFDKPEKLAIQFKFPTTITRIGCHNIYNTISERLENGDPRESFFQTQSRVDRALSTLGL